MVPDSAKSSLGLEYFCLEGDDLWCMADRDLVELGKREVERIGLARAGDVEDGCVFRVPKAYPIYSSDYRDALGTVRAFVEGLENLQTIGRNGLHRYNNQDHAMLTGMLAARNLALGERNALWSVNVDEQYHEEVRADALSEEKVAAQRASARVFNTLDSVAFGAAVGSVSGVGLGIVTAVVALGGTPPLLDFLGLAGQYFPGYQPSAEGSLLGLLYGFAAGFAGGWLFASMRNAALAVYLSVTYRRTERSFLERFFDLFY